MKILKKQFLSCCKDLDIIKIHGNNVEITSLQYDSRKVEPGAVFFALPGLHVDGSKFINSAIEKGAVAVVHETKLNSYVEGVCYLHVKDARKAMAPISACFFDFPSEKMKVIGVTATEGKSSTVSFIWQLLNAMGKTAGYFSTVSYAYGKKETANPEHQTTPESITVQERLHEMIQAGCEYAVVEASSHGLSPKTGRLDNVHFDAGVFINVTHEHLEFHGSFENYRNDKANLFRALNLYDHDEKSSLRFGVVNLDDPSAEFFINATSKPVFGFSVTSKHIFKNLKADNFQFGLYAENITESAEGISFTINKIIPELMSTKIQDVNIRLAGKFNVQNILASIITVSKITSTDIKDVLSCLNKIKPITGRMCLVNEGQDFEVLIDYAHTPSSFETILPPIYKRIKTANKKLIAVFGSGGERDTQKRPEQGRIASKYCDIIILANEDPRGENPTELLEMIATGCTNKKRNEELFIIPNRPTAIKKAFSLASPGDAVLLLGKGHENSIIFKDHIIPYDEEKEARNALKAMVNKYV
ncbi:MAG: UDP-N-acetylmuramoyl-L-alanyl-D-glutamate--2,6-diaminopimelate ligase [Treponema sp.]|nr:MAG: UDP-N-acetylmuramoyl-L-alanyl-D-glutamate--2,6-diaminopimelate ligase [Treponema sp.]